jgi:hypothetical protein
LVGEVIDEPIGWFIDEMVNDLIDELIGNSLFVCLIDLPCIGLINLVGCTNVSAVIVPDDERLCIV